MKNAAAFLLLLALCTGSAMAAYSCSQSVCTDPGCQSGQNGALLFQSSNEYFFTHPPQLTINGKATSVTTWQSPYKSPASEVYAYLPAGTYTFTLKAQNYATVGDTVTICAQKFTTVPYNPAYSQSSSPDTLGKIGGVITAAAVTLPTTTTTTAPATQPVASPAPSAPVTQSQKQQTVAPVQAGVPESTGTPGASPSSSAGAGAPGATGSSQAPTGSLAITTAPAGAAVYIDGVQRGITPATIPGLAAGDHTILLKMDGYSDLSAPVAITAGQVTEYSTGLAKSAKSPAFEAIAAMAAVAALLLLRKSRA